MSNTVGYSLGCVTQVRYSLTQGEDVTGSAVGYSLGGCPLPDPPEPLESSYYELPFYHTLNVGYDTAPITMLFRGRVRLWESGTVELDGHILSTRAGKAYRVWVGPNKNNGAYLVVGTTTRGATWEKAYWAYRPDEGSYVHAILGADIGVATWLRKLWSFEEGGWSFPIVFDNFQTYDADMDGTILRSETEVTCTGTAYRLNSSSAWDWWNSVTPGEAPGDWVFSGYSGCFQVATPTYKTVATIPDSATSGIYARWYSGSPYPTEADVTRICAVGPFYRPAYDPTPQTGTDPLRVTP